MDAYNSSWKNKVDGCHSALRFNKESLSVYPISAPVTASPQMWDYEIQIDCNHSKLNNTSTEDKITVQFYSGSDKVGESSLSGRTAFGVRAHCDAYGDAYFAVRDVPGEITKVKVSNNGNDALYVDEMFLNRTNSVGATQDTTIHH